jgi:hypothetical protein
MRGEFIGVWPETWRGVWSKLAKHPSAPADLFCELYRELVGSFSDAPDVTGLADIVDQPDRARAAFRRTRIRQLCNRYFLLVGAFIEKFSLRNDLRRPFTIHPTLSGVFARLIRELRLATDRDAALHPLMLEFEEAVRDLRSDRSSGKIKSCIQKQVNLLEAIGQRCPGVTTNTLSRICDQVGTWPHNKIKEATKDVYGFACDYPGIRQGGTASNQIRENGMRDLVSISVVLAGFSPYLTDLVSPDNIYRGT